MCLHKPVGVKLVCVQGCVSVGVPPALLGGSAALAGGMCCLHHRAHAQCPTLEITAIQSSEHDNIGGRWAKLLPFIQHVNAYVRFFHTKKVVLICLLSPWECFEPHTAFEVQCDHNPHLNECRRPKTLSGSVPVNITSQVGHIATSAGEDASSHCHQSRWHL